VRLLCRSVTMGNRLPTHACSIEERAAAFIVVEILRAA
jgi:hypothetical protein